MKFENENEETDIFNILFESIQDFAFLLLSDRSITDVNRNALDHLHYTENDLINISILNLIVPTESPKAHKQLLLINEFNNRVIFETVIETKHKEQIPVELTAIFMGVEDMGTTLVTMRDIRLRKQLESGFVQNTAPLNILDSSPDGILILDEKNNIIDVNKPYLQFSGFSKEKLLKMNYSELLVTPEDLNDAEEEDNFLFNKYHVTRKKDIIPVYVKKSPIKLNNRINRVIVFVRTIHYELKLIKIIREERKIMENILSALSQKKDTGLLIYKKITGFCFANDYICEALGYTKDELMKLKQSELFHPDDIHELAESIVDVYTNVKHRSKINARFLRKDLSIIQTKVTITNHKDDSGVDLTVLYLENIVFLDEKLTDSSDTNLGRLVSKLENHDSSAFLIGKPVGGFVYANKNCYSAFGYENKEMEKIRGSEIIHADDFKTMLKNGIKILTGLQKANSSNLRFIKKDGSHFTADLTLTKIKEGKASFIVLQFANFVYAEAGEHVPR